MPTTGVTIEAVAGSDLEVNRTVTSIPSGTAMTKAWFTVKGAFSDADPGDLQKEITTSDVPGTGQIEDDGAGDQEGVLRFDITDVDTTNLEDTSRSLIRYLYDIKILLDSNKLITLEMGLFLVRSSVTDATS